MREKKRLKKRRMYVKREKENLAQVGNMLRDIDHKLKQNTKQITASLQDLRKELKPIANSKSTKGLRLIHNQVSENLHDRDPFDLPVNTVSKIPVVVYNDKFINKHSDDSLERVNRS